MSATYKSLAIIKRALIAKCLKKAILQKTSISTSRDVYSKTYPRFYRIFDERTVLHSSFCSRDKSVKYRLAVGLVGRFCSRPDLPIVAAVGGCRERAVG